MARKKKDESTEKAIIRILKREHDKKTYGMLRVAMGKQRGLPAVQITVPCETGPDPIFLEKSQVNDVAGTMLSERFVTAHHAPLSSGQLLDDIGYLGATPAVKEILKGTYVYPPDMDHHTRLLLEEAACLFAKTAGDVISIFVTTKDFQDWWLTANGNIQSLKLGAHFGHYVAAAHDERLAALHVATLNLALQTGVPLERWGDGLTVLLEMEFGSI